MLLVLWMWLCGLVTGWYFHRFFGPQIYWLGVANALCDVTRDLEHGIPDSAIRLQFIDSFNARISHALDQASS